MQIRNRVTLIGRLGTPPQRKLLTTHTTFTRFRLATDEFFRDAKGQRQKRTTWHTVIAFGKLADQLQQTLEKGDQIALEGTLRYREWKDKHEQNRVTVEIVAREFTYLGSKRVGATAPPAATSAALPTAATATTTAATADSLQTTDAGPSASSTFATEVLLTDDSTTNLRTRPRAPKQTEADKLYRQEQALALAAETAEAERQAAA